jgi:hypothetical protein
MAMAAMLFYLPQPCSVTPRLFQTTRFADFTTAKRAFTSQLARPRATAPMLQKNATGWWFHQPHNIWESIWIISIPNRYQDFNAYREEKWLYIIFIYIYIHHLIHLGRICDLTHVFSRHETTIFPTAVPRGSNFGSAFWDLIQRGFVHLSEPSLIEFGEVQP